MEKPNKKTKWLLWGSLGLAAIATFFVFKGNGVVAKTPQQRFLEDAFNPATPWGAEVKSWLTTGGRQYNDETIKEIVNYHINNNTGQFQKYLV